MSNVIWSTASCADAISFCICSMSNAIKAASNSANDSLKDSNPLSKEGFAHPTITKPITAIIAFLI